jgi:hypothetical protein
VLIDDRAIGASLSRNPGSPTAPGEATEAELDRLIERRSRQRDGDEENELWRESVRRYNDRKQEQLRNEWCEYHQGQAERHRTVLEALIARHEDEAAKLMEVQQEGGVRTWS